MTRLPAWFWRLLIACPLVVSAAATAAAEMIQPPQASTAEVSLTLEQCVRIGLQNATSVLKSYHQSVTAGVALLQGYAQFLPDLDSNDEVDRNWGHSYYAIGSPILEQTDNYGGNLGLTSNINLFNGFYDVASLRASIRRNKAAQLSLEYARQAVALDVIQSFLQVVLDQEELRIDQGSLDISRAREALFAAQSQVGQRTYVDLYQQQAQTSATESGVISAQAKAHDDLLLLLRKLRMDVRKNYSLAPDATSQPPDKAGEEEDALISYALKHRADLEAARDALEAAQEDVTRARKDYFPTVGLSLGAASSARHFNELYVNGADDTPPDQLGLGPQFSDHINYTATASLSWQFFSRLVTKLNVTQTKESALDAGVDYEDDRRKVEADVQQALTDYRAAQRQDEASAAGLKAAQLTFEAMQARFEVGAASLLDLITAQAVFVQAQAVRAQATENLALQGHAMEFALGDMPNAR